MKHGTINSKIRGVQKAELGIWGVFARSGALSGLGLGPFGTWLGCFRTVSLGCFQKHTGGKQNNKREIQSKNCVHSHLSGWFRAHKKGVRRAEMKNSKRYSPAAVCSAPDEASGLCLAGQSSFNSRGSLDTMPV